MEDGKMKTKMKKWKKQKGKDGRWTEGKFQKTLKHLGKNYQVSKRLAGETFMIPWKYIYPVSVILLPTKPPPKKCSTKNLHRVRINCHPRVVNIFGMEIFFMKREGRMAKNSQAYYSKTH